MENKFKVGDLIRGINKEYSITDIDMTKARVIEVYNGEQIRLEILEHKTRKEEVGKQYDVESEYFELINTLTLSDLQFADILTLRNGERYVVGDNYMYGENGRYYRDCDIISDYYNEDLTQNENDTEEDIVKVERAGQVIYERQETVKVTMEDVCKKFGYDVEIVKEKKENK